jgi:hypothetical protein
MKKALFFFAVIAGLFLTTAIVVAQDVVPVPDDVMDIITQLNLYFGSLAGIAAITTFLAALLNGLLKVTKKIVKQLIAWLVAILLLIGANLLNYGFAAEFSILKSILYGFGAGLVANGLFDIPFVKMLLDTVEGWFKPKA